MGVPVVHGARYSTYVRSVLLALAEKGVDYALNEVDVFHGAGAGPEHLARQPFGKIPVLEHDGFALYETAAILRYVDEAFDGPALQPAEPRGRARMMQAIGVLDSYAYRTLVWDIFVESSEGRTRAGGPDEAKIAAAVPKAATCLAALAALLAEGPHFGGARPSLADLHAVPIFAYFRLTPEGGQLLAGAPSLARWWGLMSGRASVQATRFAAEARS